jgi:hypothetical protein
MKKHGTRRAEAKKFINNKRIELLQPRVLEVPRIKNEEK